MANEKVNKVVLGNETLIDLTGDTVNANNLLAGATAHDNRGEQIEGEVVVPEELNDLDDVDNNSPQEGDVLVSDENGVYQNKPIGEATGLASINTTGATNTTGSTITAGTYFYLDGVLVRAKANIANGATFTLNTNYEIVSAGALNSLASRYKILATANGNQTYRAQIGILRTVYNTLSDDEKSLCRLRASNSNIIFLPQGLDNGIFSRIGGIAQGNLTANIYNMNNGDGYYYNYDSGTSKMVDSSTSTNTNTVYLEIMQIN